MPTRLGSAMRLDDEIVDAVFNVLMPSKRSGPLSRLTKRLPKPDEPRTFGREDADALGDERLVVAAESRAAPGPPGRHGRLTTNGAGPIGRRTVEPAAQLEAVVRLERHQLRADQRRQIDAGVRAVRHLARGRRVATSSSQTSGGVASRPSAVMRPGACRLSRTSGRRRSRREASAPARLAPTRDRPELELAPCRRRSTAAPAVGPIVDLEAGELGVGSSGNDLRRRHLRGVARCGCVREARADRDPCPEREIDRAAIRAQAGRRRSLEDRAA